MPLVVEGGRVVLAKTIAKPLLALAVLLPLAACGGGQTAEVSDEGKVAGAGPRAEMVRLINLQRKKAGIPPLTLDAKLAAAADAHATVMAKNACVKYDCGGRDTTARLGDAGYRAQTSLFYISAGQAGPEELIRAMMGWDWGRDMILDPAYRHVAPGYSARNNTYRHYWAIGFAAPAIEDLGALVAEVVRLTNIEREKHGVPPLAMSAELNKSAQFHAAFMAENDCFDHRCPNEPKVAERIRNAGYQWRMAAENIAAGDTDAAEVVESWMKSTGHRENILHPKMREIGVGYVLVDQDGGKQTLRHYWVQNFGAR
jgi:uncharacterized protein YkwD